jgi:hypothetical protein
MGSRLKGRIHKGAMPMLHRYVGNPVLTRVLNRFYGSGVSDAHCGMRALRRDTLDSLDLRMPGMEFASEMVIRASKAGLRIEEIPIEYHVRRGESKLNSFRDGWRHLRFLLVHSPTHLFLAPGIALFAAGLLAMIAILADLNLLGRQWDLTLDDRRGDGLDRRCAGRQPGARRAHLWRAPSRRAGPSLRPVRRPAST